MNNPEFMQNAEGHLVPFDKVSDRDKLEDEMVRSLIEKADAFNAELRKFREHAFIETNAFVDILASKYETKMRGKKGNMTFTSFDGQLRVQISVADNIVFGPELQIAKNLIDECIKDWGAGSNDNIRVLVDHAFRVDKQNQVNVSSILGLRRLNIQDDKWKRAMDAIGESMRVVATKHYVRFYRRPNPSVNFEQISWSAWHPNWNGSVSESRCPSVRAAPNPHHPIWHARSAPCGYRCGTSVPSTSRPKTA